MHLILFHSWLYVFYLSFYFEKNNNDIMAKPSGVKYVSNVKCFFFFFFFFFHLVYKSTITTENPWEEHKHTYTIRSADTIFKNCKSAAAASAVEV